MSTNPKELLSRLKTSLPKVEPSTAPAAPVHAVLKAGGGAEKRSVSLYQPDLDRLDNIKAYMGKQGFRNLSDSEALRLACRAVTIDHYLLDIYRAMQQEDGRKKAE